MVGRGAVVGLGAAAGRAVAAGDGEATAALVPAVAGLAPAPSAVGDGVAAPPSS